MWSREAVEKALGRAGALLLIGAVERLLFTRVALPRIIAQRVLAPALARIEPEFDATLYLRQFRNDLRRRRAARAPALHYAILGWREYRVPNSRFDPAHYRRVTPELTEHREPFDHYLRIGRTAGATQNESAFATPESASASPMARALVLHHGRGGGSSRLLTLFERHLVSQGVSPLRLRPLTKTSPALFVCEDMSGEPLVFDLHKDQADIVAFARRMGVVSLLVNHVIDMPADILPWIVSASRALGVPYDIILHDYFAVCPRVNLVDDRGRFCGVAGAERCLACVAAGGAEVEAPGVADWRGRFAGFLAGARNVVAPSADAQRRLEPHIGRDIAVWSPQEETAPIRWRPIEPDEPLKVALLGGLTTAKGAEVVYRLARAIRSAKAPIELHLIGSSANDRRLRSARVVIGGRYREQEIQFSIAGVAPHIAFIPSIWPETWSFVLSDALSAGLPTAVFDIGAPAERLRRLGRGEWVIPLALADDAARLLEYFMSFRNRLVLERKHRTATGWMATGSCATPGFERRAGAIAEAIAGATGRGLR